MEYNSCFDIIGPVMVGPSSSHTAGVVSIGKFVHTLLDGVPDEVEIVLYDSFAQTYQGHGTDKALLGGLLGMESDDTRIKNALTIVREQKMEFHFQYEDQCPYFDHPNTTLITARKGQRAVEVGGVSLGGGLSKIFMVNGESVNIRLSTNDDLSELVKHVQKNAFPDDQVAEGF